MLFGVMIDMSNSNSLIALAYIKESDNPLSVFCNYILYCLTISRSNSLRYDQLSEKISSEFGLKLSTQMLKVCLRILHNQNRIEILPHGAGYCLKGTHFNVTEFDSKREAFRLKEKVLVEQLVLFANNFKCNWTYDEARQHLSDFLIIRQNAAKLFSDGTVENVEKENYITPQWYVSKYVSSLLNERNDNTDYLLDIVSGLMVYIGVYQTQDYQQEKDQKFQGTDFYIDTKLLLRAMGYSWQLEVDSAKELLQLIVNEYGGNICVFEHTIGEIEAALFNAAESLKRGEQIFDFELSVFAILNKCDAYDFELYFNGVRNTIEEKLKYRIQPLVQWEDTSIHKYNLNWNALIEYIKAKHPMWKKRAIENDVSSINYINILRKGNYSIRFGGKKKLPVFITSNTSLVWDIHQYILENGEAKNGATIWNVNALPIISDNMIMCRLWLPKAKSLIAVPALTLARNAYAAQQSDTSFYERLRATAQEIKSKHSVDVINLSEIRKDRLEEIIIKKVSGNIEDITPNIVAKSVDELVAFETMYLKNDAEALKLKNEKNVLVIQNQKQQIIQSASLRFKNKIGKKRCWIYIAKSWWIINSVVFSLITIILAQVKGNPSISTLQYFEYVYIIVFVGTKLLEKLLNKPIISDFFLRKAVTYVWGKYSTHVKSSLVGYEKELEKEILLLCLIDTPLFSKYQKYCIFDSVQIFGGKFESNIITQSKGNSPIGG